MTTWFTSDLHIGHNFVAGLRGFWTDMPDVPSSLLHMEAIEKSWSVVKPHDIVWILGDICISGKTWTTALYFLRDLPGRKRLVLGNHDPASSVHRDAWKYRQDFAHLIFETMQDFAKIRLGSRTVLLSHYPYSGVGAEGLRGEDQDERQERYTEFRLTDCGTPLLHGHTHGTERLHFSDAGTPQVHVGLDAWDMKLVPQHEVEKLLDNVRTPVKVEA